MLSPLLAKNVGKFECVVGKLKIGEIVGNIHLERKMIIQVLLTNSELWDQSTLQKDVQRTD